MLIRFLLTITILLSHTLYAEPQGTLYTLIRDDTILNNGKIIPKDKYMGDINAPVTIIEYASFSCIHCATFSKDVLPTLKQQYIDTGKVLFIFRDFPLNAEAFKASQVAHCYISEKYCSEDKEKCKKRNYFDIYHVLFDSLSHWAQPDNTLTKLKEVLKIGQINLDQCLADKTIQDQLFNAKLLAIRNLRISSAPTFFINGRKYSGKHSVDDFAQEIDKEIIKNHKG